MDTKNLGITDQIFPVFCVNLLLAVFGCASLYIKRIQKKESRDKRKKPKKQHWRRWITDLYPPKSHLIGHYFVFNSLPINPLKIVCNKELALCLPPITASWEQKSISKIRGVFERTKQNCNGFLPSWDQLNRFSCLRPFTKVTLRKK